MIEATRNLVEAAGAAPLAAALALAHRARGRRVGLVASGGNVTRRQLLDVLVLDAQIAAARKAIRISSSAIGCRRPCAPA